MVDRVAAFRTAASWGEKVEEEIKSNPTPLNSYMQLRL